jgi:hypothetical protein
MAAAMEPPWRRVIVRCEFAENTHMLAWHAL